MSEIKALSKSQRGFLAEIRRKHNAAFEAEFSRAVTGVIEELGLSEEIKAGKTQFQLAKDYSTITIVRPEKPPVPPGPTSKIPVKLKK